MRKYEDHMVDHNATLVKVAQICGCDSMAYKKVYAVMNAGLDRDIADEQIKRICARVGLDIVTYGDVREM